MNKFKAMITVITLSIGGVATPSLANSDYSDSLARWSDWQGKPCNGVKVKNSSEKTLSCSVGYTFNQYTGSSMNSGTNLILSPGQSKHAGVCGGVVTQYKVTCVSRSE